ncbi:hypothetical protein LUZ60_014595 [Juncus effusus]|nr:hypothetical protein LUZ60_014595 [Juncus effusus]
MGMEFRNPARSNSLYNLDLEEEDAPQQTLNSSSTPSPSSSSPIFVEKEHMFDKVVTPSDVGKLNRLVIPKQHAEKYFPLDTSANEKGLLLSFEDRAGKPWRFRYSYWNSSQSYVMTKGWSRFVKEKRLSAGDTVSFCRGVGEAGRGRFFIDWRRRPEPPIQQYQDNLYHQRPPIPLIPWGNNTARVLVPPYDYGSTNRYQYQYQYQLQQQHQHQQQIYFYRPQIAMQQSGIPMVLDSVPVETPGASKRLRLFGVNLDCPAGTSDESSRSESRMMNITHQYLQLAPRGETETCDLSEKEDCSLDLDL